MENKEIRKLIRKCMTNTELKELIKALEFQGIKLEVRRRHRSRSQYEPCDTKNADFHIFDDH